MGSACDFVQITPIFNFLSSPVLCNQHTSLLLAYWLGICHNFWYWDTIGRLFSIDIPRNYLSHFIIFMFYDKVQHPYFSSFQNCFVLLPSRSRLYWLDYEFASKLHQQTEENLLFFFSKQWNSFTHGCILTILLIGRILHTVGCWVEKTKMYVFWIMFVFTYILYESANKSIILRHFE